jgi:hypothetical protein
MRATIPQTRSPGRAVRALIWIRTTKGRDSGATANAGPVHQNQTVDHKNSQQPRQTSDTREDCREWKEATNTSLAHQV